MDFKIIGYAWFTGGTGTVGIVLVRNSIGEDKAYIGVADGADEEADLRKIAAWGAKFPYDYAVGIVTRTGTMNPQLSDMFKGDQ